MENGKILKENSFLKQRQVPRIAFTISAQFVGLLKGLVYAVLLTDFKKSGLYLCIYSFPFTINGKEMQGLVGSKVNK